MIDVGSNSFPVLNDVNGDGLPDLVIGDFGYYDSSYYSSGNPSFRLYFKNFII